MPWVLKLFKGKKMAVRLEKGVMHLSGFVGQNYFDEGFTSTEVNDALMEHGRDKDIIVKMNSGGGIASEGVAIYNSFMSHDGKVTMVNESMAASAASLIFMAGDERIMREGATLMIHDPATITIGTAEDHAKTSATLDLMADEYAYVYANRSGNDQDDVREIMIEETWFNGKDAVAQGYATSTDTKAKRPKACSPFDFRIYSNAPEKLVVLSKEKQWSMSEPEEQSEEVETAEDQTQEPEGSPATEEKEALEMGKSKLNAEELAEIQKEAVEAHQQRRENVLAMPGADVNMKMTEHLIQSNSSEEDIKTQLSFMEKPEAKGKEPGTVMKEREYERGRIRGAGLSDASPTASEDEEKPKTQRQAAKDIYAKRREAQEKAAKDYA